MAIEDKIWNELSPESRQYIIAEYTSAMEEGRSSFCEEDTMFYQGMITGFRHLFGRHNLPDIDMFDDENI